MHVAQGGKLGQNRLKMGPFHLFVHPPNGPGSILEERVFDPFFTHFGMLKQVFLARFEPVVMRCGPWKMPKCLVKGPFWDQKWVKNGSKTRLSKRYP